MNARFASGLVLLAFLTACDEDSGTGTSPTPAPSGAISATVQFNLASAYSGRVTGIVSFCAGVDTFAVVVDTTLDGSSTIQVSRTLTDVFPGRAGVVSLARLAAGADSLIAASYAFADIAESETTTVSADMFRTISRATVNGLASAPAFSNLTFDTVAISAPVLTVRDTAVTNVDFDMAFVYAGGNCYPAQLQPDSAGRSPVTATVSLNAGANRIIVMCFNSTGAFTIKELLRATYLPPGDGGLISATLIWDSPASDLDLHLWYYDTAYPALPSTAAMHCAFWNRDIGILPDGAGARGNLSIDDTAGYGPERLTLTSLPDGYYVLGVNCYTMRTDSVSRATLTVCAGADCRTVQQDFSIGNEAAYDSTLAAWWRPFDLRVVDRRITVLTPDSAFAFHDTGLRKVRK